MSRVCVLGNAMVDLSMMVPRLPVPGETLVASGLTRAPGGKGLNQAVAASRAGASVLFRAPVGADPDGDFLASALAGERCAVRLLRQPRPTDVSVLLVAADAENCIVSVCACAEQLDAAAAEAVAAELAAGDWLLLQGNLGAEATAAAARRAVRGGARVLFNPAPIRWPADAVLAASAVVVANRGEAVALADCADPAAAATALRARGPAIAVVTLGAAGCVWSDGAGVHADPAPVVRAVDTTGSGDTFCGVLAACLAAGAELTGAIAVAQRAAALAATRRGAFAAIPSVAELAALLT
jgi:ribokinase